MYISILYYNQEHYLTTKTFIFHLSKILNIEDSLSTVSNQEAMKNNTKVIDFLF